MTYNPDNHHRRSIRLKGRDYSQSGAYYMTICTQNRLCLFGNVINKEMILNDAGNMIEKWWFELPNKFSSVELDCFIIMPNHIHGILFINNNDGTVGVDLRVYPNDAKTIIQGRHIGLPLPTHFPTIMQWLQTMITNEYIRNVKNNDWPPFNGKLFQRNYYEHIIRDENDLNRIRQYIINNPANWEKDENYL